MKQWMTLTFLIFAISTLGCSPKKVDEPKLNDDAQVQRQGDVAQAQAPAADDAKQAAPAPTAEAAPEANPTAPDANANDDIGEGEQGEQGCGRMYGKFAKDRAIPLPKKDGKTVEYSEGYCDGNYNAFKMENFDFRNDYEKDLIAAGFEKIDNAFVKGSGTPNESVVAFHEDVEAPVEPYILIMAGSRDPQNQYTKLPDKRIPYPLNADGMAAYVADLIEPNEASNETVFVYVAQDKAFVMAYQKRLENAGFANVRIPEAPLYTKSVDGNIELSVAIESDFDDPTMPVRIKMMVIKLGE